MDRPLYVASMGIRGEERAQRLLRRILGPLLILCAADAMIVWIPGVSPAPLFGSMFILSLAGALILAWRLNNQGHVRAASTTTVGVLLFAIAIATFIFGGIRGPDSIALVPLLFLVGLLHGRRFAMRFAAVVLLVVLLLVGLEALGFGPVVMPPLGLAESAVIYLIILIVSGVFLGHAIEEIDGSLEVADRAVRAARASEARVSDMVEQLPDGFVAMSADGVVTECNPRMAELLGISCEAMIGCLLVDLKQLTPGSRGRWLQLLAEIRGGRDAGLIEISLGREGREPRVLELHTRRVRTIGEELAVHVIARDVSARVRAAVEKADLETQLLESHRLESLGRLAGGVAHDFNNLLTAIVANSDLLARRTDETDRKLAEEIQQAGQRAAGLTQQLLAFACKQVREPRVMCINQAVHDVLTIFRRLLPEDIEVQLDVDESLSRVRADPGQMEQVILNLVTNARDAMPRGGVIAIRTRNIEISEPECERHQISPGLYALLSVGDTGEGIDAAVRGHLFEPFFSTKGNLGSGLGLATVHGIVKQSGGCIRVDSEPGRGARFEVCLPVVAEEIEPREVRRVFTPAAAGARLLVVDDERLVRETAARLLRAAGYEVAEADGAEQALERIREHDGFDLLVTDVVLPNMRGPELARLLRKELPGLRVLFISGYAEEVIFHDGVLDSGVDFLAKPFSFESLTAKVAEVLAPPTRS